jgi:hypothetical protein
MKVYELTLKGFDGSTDETDHLVLWISCQDHLSLVCNGSNILTCGEIPVDPSAVDIVIEDQTSKEFLEELLTFSNMDDDGDVFFCKEYDFPGVVRNAIKKLEG